jgi:DNA mismatch repair protein MSH2
MIRDLCDSYQELSESYNKIQRDVAKEVISITASYFPVLEQLNQVVAHLDVLTRYPMF